MPVGSLPVTLYIPLVGVHATLLGFTALFLPRTTFLRELIRPEWDTTQLTSRDRPQHPFLEALTMSPVSTLACMCAGVIVLQGWWAGWIRDLWLTSVVAGNKAERKMEKVLMNDRKLKELGSAWGATIFVSFIFHFLFVLFGAPLVNHVLRTYLLSLLLAALVFFTPAYVLSPPSFANDPVSLVKRMTWVRLFAEFSSRNPIERAIMYPAWGAIAGCWFGVVPIALDWDRPWQAWPLTPAFGAIGGYVLASIFCLTVNATTGLTEQRNMPHSGEKRKIQ
ncbi:GPI biosynthesis protein family Pig-F-domain-containing protein [Cyathus striatus]|nr:GPI biosynthesis protein family Pig-F-domain-containing protein [Cyathus striatus]